MSGGSEGGHGRSGVEASYLATDGQTYLSTELGCNVVVTYTRARHTPLQVRPWRGGDRRAPERLEVRMHAMFTAAPTEVHRAVASWIRSGRRAPRACAVLDRWIATSLERLAPAPARSAPLCAHGEHHDLTAMAADLCAGELAHDPFECGRAPGGTWGRRTQSRTRHSLRLGSFDPVACIVRIHPVLDQATVPAWFVRFVLFHELLHAVMPPKLGPDSRWVHHSHAFRRRERAYADYKKAIAWEEANMPRLIHSARTGKPFGEKSAARATPSARAPRQKRRWFQMPLFPSL